MNQSNDQLIAVLTGLKDLVEKQGRELSALRSVVETIVATQAADEHFVSIFRENWARIDAGFNGSTVTDAEIQDVKAAYLGCLPRGFAELLIRPRG